MKKPFLILTICLASKISKSQNAVSGEQKLISYCLSDWKSYPIPSDSTVLTKYSHCKTWWRVFEKDGRPYAADIYSPKVRELIPAPSLPNPIRDSLMKNENLDYHQGEGIYAVEDGYLIGWSEGEGSGKLVWYSKDGSKNYTISGQPVRRFIEKRGRIYAIEGVDHLSASYGSIIQISKWGGKWESDTQHTLPYAPIGIDTTSEGNFLIATTNDLLEIGGNNKYVTLIENAFWSKYDYLYPNSLGIINDTAYIGMTMGVFKMDLKTGKQEWLMKD